MKFKDIYEFYSWGSQCNMFAPRFDDLSNSCKNSWIEQFEEYQAKKGILYQKLNPTEIATHAG